MKISIKKSPLSKLLLVYLLAAISLIANSQNTYYSQGTTGIDVNVTTNWDTNPLGGDTDPTGFGTAADTFIIQASDTCIANADWTVAGMLFIEGELNTGSNVVTIGDSIDISGTLIVDGTGTMTCNGDIDANGGTITFTGSGSLNLDGAIIDGWTTLNEGTGTIVYGGGAQNIIADTYYNLSLSGDDTKTAIETINVGGAFFTDTIFDMNSRTVTITGAADINEEITISTGTLTFNGDFTGSGSTISFTGAGT
ncbi:hypothetical protein ACFLTE_08870, partial [Bacteroidota bacterium]